MVRKLVMWELMLCLEHSILIIAPMLRFEMTRWDNFDSYNWTLVIGNSIMLNCVIPNQVVKLPPKFIAQSQAGSLPYLEVFVCGFVGN